MLLNNVVGIWDVKPDLYLKLSQAVEILCANPI